MGHSALMVRDSTPLATAGKVGLLVLALTAGVVIIPPLLFAGVIATKVALAALSIVVAIGGALFGLFVGGLSLIGALTVAGLSLAVGLCFAIGGLLLKLGLFVALPVALVVFIAMALSKD